MSFGVIILLVLACAIAAILTAIIVARSRGSRTAPAIAAAVIVLALGVLNVVQLDRSV